MDQREEQGETPRYGESNAPCAHRGQQSKPYHRGTACHALPLDPVGTLIIANRSRLRLWTTNGLELGRLLPALPGFFNQLRIASGMFLLPRQRTLDGFGRFDTSRPDQLGRKVRILLAQSIVCLFMQVYAVTTSCFKSKTGHGIEARSVLFKRASQKSGLLSCGMQLYHNGSIHAESISYTPTFVNTQRIAPVPRPQERKTCFIPIPQARVS